MKEELNLSLNLGKFSLKRLWIEILGMNRYFLGSQLEEDDSMKKNYTANQSSVRMHDVIKRAQVFHVTIYIVQKMSAAGNVPNIPNARVWTASVLYVPCKEAKLWLL